MNNNYLLALNGGFPLIESMNYITCSPAFVLKSASSVAVLTVPKICKITYKQIFYTEV